MPRTIVLPKELEQRLYGLTQTQEESNGVLLYREIQGHCFVEHLFMTGIGTEGNVRAFQERMNVVNEFFRTHPEYKYIKFHVHTKGTIAQHGNYFARNFSAGDRAGTQEQLRHNPEFIALLVTPETILLDAPDTPILHVVNESRNYTRMHEYVAKEIEKAADRLEIDIKTTFKARRATEPRHRAHFREKPK